MVLLRDSNPARPICRDCRKPADTLVDGVRCYLCEQAHQAKIDDVAEFERIREDERPRCRHCFGRIKPGAQRSFCSAVCANAYRAKDALAFIDAARQQLDINAATGVLHRLFEDEPDDLAEGPSVDHVTPRSKGGTHDLTNLALTHRRCNSRKGARDAEAETERIRQMQ